MPKVSVIIPVYNGEKYVAQAIDSVLAQTFRDFEIIVVDDSSTDSSAQIAQRYQDKLTYYKKENRGLGPPDSMHYGISRAQGEYFAVLGHDDIWLPEMLAESVNALDAHPQAAFVFSDAYVINADNQVTGKLLKGGETALTFEKLLEGNFVSHLAAVMRRDIYNELGGMDITLYCTHDWDLWLRCAQKYPYIHVDKLLSQYRVHDNNTTVVHLDRYLKDDLAIYNKPEYVANVSFLKLRWFKSRIYYKLAGLYKKAGQFRKAGNCYFMSAIMFLWIGAYYWPKECRGWRLTLPYRILKIYYLAVYYWLKSCFLPISRQFRSATEVSR